MIETGDEYLDSSEFREMLAEYEKAKNTGQPVFMDADELAEIADFYQMTNQEDEAEAAINMALSLSPGAIAPLTYRIHEALSKDDIAKAKEYFAQILETSHPDYIYMNAEIMLAEGREEDADLYLREQLKSVPADEYRDYVIDVGNLLIDYGCNEKALEWVMRAQSEDSADIKELTARTLFGLGKYKDSERLFNELLDTDPFQKRYWHALASAQFMNEDYSESVQSSEFAIAIDPEDPEGIISKANGLFRLGNYSEALEYYRRYSEKEPDDEFSYLYQGTCLINLNQYGEAITVLLKALDLGVNAETADLADIYQELAFAYSENGEKDKALEYLEITDDLECDHAQVEVVKGHILLSADHVEEATKHFQSAIHQCDGTPMTMLRIIASLYDNNYLEAAYMAFKTILETFGNDQKNGYAYMALCCYDLKRYDEFLKYLKIACERNPGECQQVIGHLFPDSLTPGNYYEYIKDKIKK